MTKAIINIRTAIPADAAQIAYVHIDCWQTTYRNIVADEYLGKLNIQTRTNYWNRELSVKCDNVFVAESKGGIVGFATVGEGRDKNDYQGELYSIYILQHHQHKNIGRLLMATTIQYLQVCGYNSMYVWVLAANNSKYFYERLGGEMFDDKEIEIDGQKLTEIAYGWRDISKLTTLNTTNG